MLKCLKIIMIASCIFTTTACSSTSRPIANGTNTEYYGNITSGSKFNMAIGDNESIAANKLSQQFNFDLNKDVTTCSNQIKYSYNCSGQKKYFTQFRLKNLNMVTFMLK